MEFEELLEMLEIENPQDMAYFEQYAELVENEEEITEDTLIQFFLEVDKDNLEELTTNYFEELFHSIPDEAADFYSTVVGISQAFIATAKSLDNDDNRTLYAEMFYKFRNWLIFEADVRCTNISTEEESILSILQALSLYRAQNLSDEEYNYDFDDVLEYPIDEYIIPLSSFDDDENDIDLYDDVDDE